MRFFLFVTSVILCFSLSAQNADMIISNARLYSHGKLAKEDNALAIKDGIILAIGPSSQMLKYRDKNTKMLDAAGQFLMPGLIEGHGHFYSLGSSNMNLILQDCKNWDEIIELVAQKVKDSAEGEWIYGRGWHQEKWDKVPVNNLLGFPNHTRLSEVAPNNPVVLTHASGHLLIANDKAMELAGINSKSVSPPGGEIFRDETGKATGIFNESAMDPIREAGAKAEALRSQKELHEYDLKCIKKATELCLKYGITSFHDAGSSFDRIDLYRELAQKNALLIRLWVMLNDDMETIEKDVAKHIKGFNNMFFRFGGIKAYMDGALGSRGAWLLKPYSDNPHTHGHRIISEKDFDKLAAICNEYHLQLCTHAIGDRANRVVFDTYQKWLDDKDRRWRIEHAQHLNPLEFSRFAELDIIAAMQPNHCTSDAFFVIKRLGEKRAEEGAYAWRTILNMNGNMNLGTDTPVESVDPFKNLYAACTRVVPTTGEAFFPKQKLSREEALYLYTLGNAYSVFEEDLKGSLEIGKLADLIIVDQDLLNCSDEELLEVSVLYTIIGGEIRYKKE